MQTLCMTNLIMNCFKKKIESVQYKAYLAITEAIQGIYQ